jgi:hypothetical protein
MYFAFFGPDSKWACNELLVLPSSLKIAMKFPSIQIAAWLGKIYFVLSICPCSGSFCFSQVKTASTISGRMLELDEKFFIFLSVSLLSILSS